MWKLGELITKDNKDSLRIGDLLIWRESCRAGGVFRFGGFYGINTNSYSVVSLILDGKCMGFGDFDSEFPNCISDFIREDSIQTTGVRVGGYSHLYRVINEGCILEGVV